MTTFPLTLNVDGRSKMTIKDAGGTTFMQAIQLANLKHKVEVITYQNHQQQVYQLEAEKLFSKRPVYDIWNHQGQTIGTVHDYDIFDGKNCVFQTQSEANRDGTIASWIHLAILITLSILCATLHSTGILYLLFIHVGIGHFARQGGYLDGVTYIVKRPDGRQVMRFDQIRGLSWKPVPFSVQLLDRVSSNEEYLALFPIILMLLERRRGDDSA